MLEHSQVRGDHLEARLEASLAGQHSHTLPHPSLPSSGVGQGSAGEEGGGGSGVGAEDLQEGGSTASSSTGTDAMATTATARDDKNNMDEVIMCDGVC